jgi:hypothetical protein
MFSSISSFSFGTRSSLVLLLLRIRHGVSRGGRVSELLVLQDWDLEFTTLNTIQRRSHYTTFSIFVKLEDYFYILSFFNAQKTLKSYVLTAYIDPHRNLHMCRHVAYAICSASPHAYSNPHFKTLIQIF